MSDFYTVMYNSENLFEYKMNEKEVLVVEEFRQELINICNDLEVPKGKLFDGSPYMGRLKDNYDFRIMYREDIGYFVISGERGKYSLHKGFPTIDRDEAKLLLLESEFSMGGFQYEVELRDILKEQWTGKYSAEYDSRKEAFEYTIRMLHKTFNVIPPRVVKYYMNCMNRWFEKPHWFYDLTDLTFKEL